MLGFAALGELPLGGFGSERNAISAANATLSITMVPAGLYHIKRLDAEALAMTIELARGRVGMRVAASGGARGIKASVGGGGKGLRIRA